MRAIDRIKSVTPIPKASAELFARQYDSPQPYRQIGDGRSRPRAGRVKKTGESFLCKQLLSFLEISASADRS
jgi:hypothetical protein